MARFPQYSIQGGSSSGYVAIQKGLPPAEDFAVLVHETAHELMHQGANRDASRSKSVCETEADAVAYVVCRVCGIDTTHNSADYIQLYRGTTATLNESLTRIQTTAAELIGKLAPPDSRSIPPSKHLARPERRSGNRHAVCGGFLSLSPALILTA